MIKNWKGFAVLETLLLIVIVITISGIGWYAIHTKHQTDKILSQADKISKDTLVKTPSGQNQNPISQGYMSIKEWGIKVPVTKDLEDIRYKIIDNGTAIIYSPIDSSTDKICVTDVAVLKGLSSQAVPGSDGMTFKQWYQQNQAYYYQNNNYYVSQAESSGVSVGCGETEDLALDNSDVLDQNSNPMLWQEADKTGTAIVNSLQKMSSI